MIVVRVEGGLGNQLFQAAFGLQLANQHQTELVLDLSSYADRPAHGYLLSHFNVQARPLRPDEVSYLPRRYQNQPISAWPDWLVATRLKRVREKPFGFSEHYLRSPDNSYLVGYWQSERFFSQIASEVRNQYRLRDGLSDTGRRLWDRLVVPGSMALHIRRGDYLTNSAAAAIYRNLSLDYYRRAVLSRLTERTGVEVTVFSNDIAWCQGQLNLPCPTHFVTESAGPHEELISMSAAEAIVIANSTFSWWAAWLSSREEPRIFAPRKWFHPGTLNDRNLACPGWTLLDDPLTHSAAA